MDALEKHKQTGYVLLYNVNCSNAKRHKHDITCDMLRFISTANLNLLIRYLRKAVPIFTVTNTPSFITKSYNCEFVLFCSEH